MPDTVSTTAPQAPASQTAASSSQPSSAPLPASTQPSVAGGAAPVAQAPRAATHTTAHAGILQNTTNYITAAPVGLLHFLILSAILLVLGIFAMLTRRNAIAVLMGIELILNAANINFVAFSRYGGINLGGQMNAIFVIVIAACEAAVALAIVLNIYKNFHSVNVAEVNKLRD